MEQNLISDKATLVKRASYLRIATASLASAMQSGAFRSLYRGRGVEFSGVREYLRGDDVRAIDWNVTARNAKPFVKIFDEERELQILLIVDRSLSMQTFSSARTRLEAASEIAALLALSAEHNSNPVGAVLFSGEVEFVVAPKTGQEHTMLLLSHLDSFPKKSRGSVLENALQGACKILKKRSLVFVISDFRVGGWENPFAILASKHDVVALKISDALDSALPEMGTIFFRDAESGAKKLFPTFSKNFQNSWREDSAMREKRWRALVTRRGGVPLSVSTADDSLAILSEFFSRKKEA